MMKSISVLGSVWRLLGMHGGYMCVPKTLRRQSSNEVTTRPSATTCRTPYSGTSLAPYAIHLAAGPLGVPERRTDDYMRHGTMTLLGCNAR
jgi:hypothetical protein